MQLFEVFVGHGFLAAPWIGPARVVSHKPNEPLAQNPGIDEAQ